MSKNNIKTVSSTDLKFVEGETYSQPDLAHRVEILERRINTLINKIDVIFEKCLDIEMNQLRDNIDRERADLERKQEELNGRKEIVNSNDIYAYRERECKRYYDHDDRPVYKL